MTEGVSSSADATDLAGRNMAELTWMEIQAAVQADLGVIIPVGATEQHGPHLPLGTDYLCATAVARTVVQDEGMLEASRGDAWMTVLSPFWDRATVRRDYVPSAVHLSGRGARHPSRAALPPRDRGAHHASRGHSVLVSVVAAGPAPRNDGPPREDLEHRQHVFPRGLGPTEPVPQAWLYLVGGSEDPANVSIINVSHATRQGRMSGRGVRIRVAPSGRRHRGVRAAKAESLCVSPIALQAMRFSSDVPTSHRRVPPC